MIGTTSLRFALVMQQCSSRYLSTTKSDLLKNGMPLLVRAAEHARMGRILAYDMYSAPSNKDRKIAYSYHDILSASAHLHKYFRKIKKQTSANDPQRIAYLCPPGPQYISTQFACWSSGSIAVPLCISHRANELAYVLKDCDPSLVIDGTSNPESSEELKIAAAEVGITDRYHCLDDLMLGFDSKANSGTYAFGSDGDINSIDSAALIIYTSGTTGAPKGQCLMLRLCCHYF